MKNCDFSWGFKISEQRADDKGKDSKGQPSPKKDSLTPKKQASSQQVQTEGTDKVILTDINLDMKTGDFLVVVG